MMVALRIIHIGGGVFWVGTILFLAFYLAPAIARAGPDGGRVMQELQKGRIMHVLPVVALLTIVSGLWLFWIMSAGLNPGYFRTGYGMSLTTGGVATIVAYVIGLMVMRPAQLRMGALAPRMADAPEEERARLGAELARLRARSGRASKVIAWLLILAVVTMAVARYV